MMKRLLFLGFMLACSALAFGQAARYDSVAQSTTIIQTKTIIIPMPLATVTVCAFPAVGGLPCTNKAPVCPDETLAGCTTSAPLNPLTADAQGNFGFWVAAGSYDYTVCPVNITAGQPCQGPFHVILALPVSATPGGTGVGAHNILSITHPDTVPNAVVKGDLIFGSGLGNPPVAFWDHLAIGVPGQILTVGPKTLGFSYPEWDAFPGATCNIADVHNWYFGPGGSDLTGTGLIGNPWATPGHAVDQIPGLICGRYLLHMTGPGTVSSGPFNPITNSGGLNLSGRVCDGGGLDNNGGAPPPTWPINDGNFPPAYSWVEIIGDTTDLAPSTFIIDNALGEIDVSGCNLILRSLQVKNGAFGVHAAHQAFVGLSGVLFDSNGTGILATEGSTVYVDNQDFLEPAFTANVLITNSTNYGFLISDDSLLTDYRSDGGNGPTNMNLEVDGPSGIACGLFLYSRAWIRGTLKCLASAGTTGFIATDSKLAVATLSVDGSNLAATTGINLEASSLSGSATGGGTYTIANVDIGAQLDSASFVDALPTFTTNIQDWKNMGLDSAPAWASGSVNGRAAEFMQTVTFSATPAFDMRQGAVKKMTLTADVTASTIINPPTTLGIAEFATFLLCQDGGGAHAFAWAANVKGADVIGAVGSKCNVQRFMYDQATTTWYAVSAMVKDQ